LRVVEMAGRACAVRLHRSCDLGADVIRVAGPRLGADVLSVPGDPFGQDRRSIGRSRESPIGVEWLRRLVDLADVFVRGLSARRRRTAGLGPGRGAWHAILGWSTVA